MGTRPLELRDLSQVEAIRIGTIGLPYFAECLECEIDHHTATYGEAVEWARSHYWTKHKAAPDVNETKPTPPPTGPTVEDLDREDFEKIKYLSDSLIGDEEK